MVRKVQKKKKGLFSVLLKELEPQSKFQLICFSLQVIVKKIAREKESSHSFSLYFGHRWEKILFLDVKGIYALIL